MSNSSMILFKNWKLDLKLLYAVQESPKLKFCGDGKIKIWRCYYWMTLINQEKTDVVEIILMFQFANLWRENSILNEWNAVVKSLING